MRKQMMKFISISEQRGFMLAEVLVGVLLGGMLLAGTAHLAVFLGQTWTKQFHQINLQQNARVAYSAVSQTLRYQAADIVHPLLSQSGDYVEFRNPGNYRTYRFYVASPNDYPTVPTLYRYVRDDKNFSPGVNQLTEPSQVMVRQILFSHEYNNAVRMRLILEDIVTGSKVETEMVISCLNGR